jgi:hypothetical protein
MIRRRLKKGLKERPGRLVRPLVSCAPGGVKPLLLCNICTTLCAYIAIVTREHRASLAVHSRVMADFTGLVDLFVD